MQRRFQGTEDALKEAERKISFMYFQTAHLRLWKEKQTTDLSVDLARARAEIVRLKTSLESILASRSWRITGPIRRLSSFLKSHSKQNQTESLAVAHPFEPHGTERTSCASPAPGAVPAIPDYASQGKAAWDQTGRKRLAEFLGSDEKIVFPAEPAPKITIILILHNEVHLSLLSLLSVKGNADVRYEVVIVDNCSDDQTSAVLSRIANATIISNRENRGFSPACMQAASQSKGEYLCFLNNDALLEANSLQPALANFDRDASVGAVGGRILLANGLLQEAGAILWCDGTTNGYGREDSPGKLEYQFRRPVDYCSGAFLFTRRQLFEELGGFDQIFAPGYYEDLDYCMRLRANGFRSIYEPLSTIRHYENASSGNKGAALTHVIANHQTFWERWRDKLSSHCEPCGENIHLARIAAGEERIKILLIANQVPHQQPDESYYRPWEVMKQLAAEGFLTCATLAMVPEEGDYIDISREVEFLDASNNTDRVLRKYVNEYDVIWVSGEGNLAPVAAALSGLDRIHSTIVLDIGRNDSSVPIVLLNDGKPSKQFGSVSQREMVIKRSASNQSGEEGEEILVAGDTAVRIWVVD